LKLTGLYADTVLFSGKIATMDAENSYAEGVAIRDGNIALVGTDSEVLETVGPKTKTIDLKGRSVLPGTHIHPSMAGGIISEEIIDLKVLQQTSIATLLDMVRKKGSETPERRWILGWGYDEARLFERRHPRRKELDEVAASNPVFLTHACGHIAVGNTLALTMGGVTKDKPDPRQGIIDRDIKGEPTGVLRNRAQDLVREHIPPMEYKKMKEGLRKACGKLASLGVTSIHDAWSGPDLIRAYQELLAEGKLPIRVGLIPPIANPFEGDYMDQLTSIRLRTGFGNPMLRIVGVKVAVDGMLRSETAALHDAYEGQPHNRGILTIDAKDLQRKAAICNAAGLRICIHAEGDRGIDIALDSIEKALDENPVEDHRHRIEHCGLCTPTQMQRMKGLGVIPSVSINFIYDIGEGYETSIGTDRAEWVYPLKSLMDNGIKASCNSDWPVSMGNPLIGLYSAVVRKTWKGDELGPNQRVSLTDAIRTYTVNAAHASFEENIKGSIEVGKLADMIVLSGDIFNVPAKLIPKIKVDMTMVGGKIVYQRSI